MKKLILSFIFIFIFSNQSFAKISHIKFAQLQEEYDDFEDFEDFNFDVSPKKEVYDPFEKVNRKIFIFNDYVDRYFFEHVAIFYRKSLPKGIRKSIRNFFNNLSAPFSVVNSIFQGNGQNAMASFSAFLINTTLGVGGLFNVAGDKEVRYYEEDLGQTFAYYGSPAGPYLMLPFFGPSNLRDGTGMGINALVSPLSVNIFDVGDDELVNEKILTGFTITSLIDKRESLLKIIEDLRNNSFDPYATARSAFMQNRNSKINNEHYFK